MTRAQLLDEAQRRIAEGEVNHGRPENTFALIASFWQAYLDNREIKEKPLNGTDVAAIMILFKAARIAVNPSHIDSWLDIAGYAACGVETFHQPEYVGQQVKGCPSGMPDQQTVELIDKILSQEKLPPKPHLHKYSPSPGDSGPCMICQHYRHHPYHV